MPIVLALMKTQSGMFVPEDQESRDLCDRVKVGQVIRGEFTKQRNYQFHRKFFALMQLGYDIWSETAPRLEYQGEPVEPRLENFRKDITILCGWFNTYVSMKGEVRLEAKSISFASMDDEEFERLYSKAISVILTRCYRGHNMDEAKLRESVEAVLRFDK